MAPKQPVVSEKGIKSPLFSQAIIHNGTVYVSGTVGMVPSTGKIVGGSVEDRTRQALENIKNVLEEAGSSLQNIVKINIFLTDMADYAAMNKACAYSSSSCYKPEPATFHRLTREQSSISSQTQSRPDHAFASRSCLARLM
ncbi:hypothetical protein A1O1_06235 [Capronia coronata CBS 617.96]|uniref:Uncharacterized protein n=1 Tax=Capronia coronata CBS 617.96 TaxID=1182541 RepID=W9Y9H7_9EURO|nr:uncharacterized protein A1O1_06235 [Capronia coronata CBS 617.96]EXJ85866.1 hypothetical protein A1O1_06235 [Capronia coronata CBS 617.96]